MDELEKVVNKMQSDAAMKCTRETDRARAYQEGYTKGIEDLYQYIRQNKIERN